MYTVTIACKRTEQITTFSSGVPPRPKIRDIHKTLKMFILTVGSQRYTVAVTISALASQGIKDVSANIHDYITVWSLIL
jgi:hypothetical protein